MTIKLFNKYRKAWSDNSLNVISIELYDNNSRKIIYRNIEELINWDNNSITFRYIGYHDYIGVTTVERKFIKKIMLFNDITFTEY